MIFRHVILHGYPVWYSSCLRNNFPAYSKEASADCVGRIKYTTRINRTYILPHMLRMPYSLYVKYNLSQPLSLVCFRSGSSQVYLARFYKATLIFLVAIKTSVNRPISVPHLYLNYEKKVYIVMINK